MAAGPPRVKQLLNLMKGFPQTRSFVFGEQGPEIADLRAGRVGQSHDDVLDCANGLLHVRARFLVRTYQVNVLSFYPGSFRNLKLSLIQRF